jgi:transposase-like protein
MSGKERRVYSAEVKRRMLERMAAGESPTALARELGVLRHKLYEWRAAFLKNGGGFRRRGRPGACDVVEAAESPTSMDAAQRRIAQLERKVGQQGLELDFFKGALRRIEASRRPSDGPGATASSRRSKR